MTQLAAKYHRLVCLLQKVNQNFTRKLLDKVKCTCNEGLLQLPIGDSELQLCDEKAHFQLYVKCNQPFCFPVDKDCCILCNVNVVTWKYSPRMKMNLAGEKAKQREETWQSKIWLWIKSINTLPAAPSPAYHYSKGTEQIWRDGGSAIRRIF